MRSRSFEDRIQRRGGFRLVLVLLAVAARPAGAQLEEVVGDFPLWSASTATWESWAFEDFYSTYPQATGCVSAAGRIELELIAGTLGLEVSNGSCPVVDESSDPDVAEGSIPAGETLTLTFDPPIRAFYASFGSLAAGNTVTLRILGDGGYDETTTSPPSAHDVLGRGYGFLSATPAHTLEITSTEAGTTLLGHFVGLVASDQTITGPGGVACSNQVNAPCDVAVATELHHPGTFVTPTTGTADLGTWPEAIMAGASGIAAGDAVCRYWATEVGYANPQRFVAFLGTGSTGPLCRVLGLTGTWSAGVGSNACDGAELPASLARWWRVDGLPWGAPLDQGDLSVRRPSLDALGDRVDGYYFTGWRPDRDCEGWTSSELTSGTDGGEPDAINIGWASFAEVQPGCGTEHHLLCFERAVGLPPGDEQTAGRIAFVTLAKGSGDLLSWPEADSAALTGPDAADSVCRSEAAAAELDQPESFRAWLSTTAADAVDRFTEPGPYVRPDGVPVAASIPDLVDGSIETGIVRHANGADSSNVLVWTGTSADGTFEGDSCGDWESTAGNGRRGRSALADATWTSLIDNGCAHDAHLYCVSDAPIVPLFADGFESGDFGAWSARVP